MQRREFITLMGGAAAAVPLGARAESSAMPVIGFLSGRSPEDSGYLVTAFKQGLADDGFVDGKNIVIEYRWASGDYGRLQKLAAQLVELPVAVLVGVGGEASARAAKEATSTIPVVFGIGGDPIGSGMVASLNRPGGNVTGVTLLTNQMEGKRLGLLHELVGSVPVGVLLNPQFPAAAAELQELREAARKTGERLIVAEASNDADLDAAFALFASERAGALLAAADPFFDSRNARIVAAALSKRLPGIFHLREYAVAGGLLSYGVNIADAYRQFGVYAAKILKGAKPADLPVQQAVKFEMVINLRTAKAIGFEFPPTFSARADEVIE